MPVHHVFAVVGDSNVRRNMTTMNAASRASMTSAAIIDCSLLASFAAALSSVAADVTVLIIQCLTSFLASATDTGSVYGTIDPILTEFSGQLLDFCSRRSATLVIVAPPFYRETPVWYRRQLPAIAKQFSSVLSSNGPRNLYLMSSAIAGEMMPDGIHFTPVSGLHYVLHLFVEAQRILDMRGSKGVCCFYNLLPEALITMMFISILLKLVLRFFSSCSVFLKDCVDYNVSSLLH